MDELREKRKAKHKRRDKLRNRLGYAVITLPEVSESGAPRPSIRDLGFGRDEAEWRLLISDARRVLDELLASREGG